MKIEKLIFVDGKIYMFTSHARAEVGDIAQNKYTDKYEMLTEENIKYMTGYYLWKPVDLCIELSDEKGLTYKIDINSSKAKYSVKAN